MVGSFAGAIGASILYTRIFADKNRYQHSFEAVIGYLVTLVAAALLGGTLAVGAGRRFTADA
ncbi:hypothetical protein LJY25_08655 [Hymenobacter sp. BT175]|uniref:hypothetical protein n=1 Tax=Hymenobacter translucens TaxID=2886507 RepID=UPI001D0F32B2|nr:hypothetical protein [Hymenobacter translucens]MCC2546511.1 hypothetical protein [Hymenobacter translucens]